MLGLELIVRVDSAGLGSLSGLGSQLRFRISSSVYCTKIDPINRIFTNDVQNSVAGGSRITNGVR